MSRRDTTLHDVAREVGVSTRTVSRVVRGEGGFSAATEARVRAAIDELGYRPNLLARGLISGRSGTIGLVGGEMNDPFFPELADGVQRAASEVGLTMFFASTDNDAARQRNVLDSLMSHGVDGVIVFPAAGTDEQLRRFAEQGLRMVTVDRVIEGAGLSSVSSDIVTGARLATDHLRQLGRTRIAFIGNRDPAAHRRHRGYSESLADDAPQLVELDLPTAAGGAAATSRLLDAHPDVDAIFAYNDLMALGVLQVLASSGRAVPADVAVVGFDDVEMSAYVTPSLTTVQLDRERLGRQAVSQMVQLIDQPSEPPVATVLPVQLVARESA